MTPSFHANLTEIPNFKSIKSQFVDTKTVLFDMDGTLFDTEKFHAHALRELGQEIKVNPPYTEQEILHMMIGKADHMLFEIIKDWPGFPNDWNAETFIQKKNEKLLTILRKTSPEQYFSEGMRVFLEESKHAKWQIGLVTSSEKIITQELIGNSKLEHYFDFILTRDDSLKLKPDPWPYLKAIEELKSHPHETLIFEDSPVGLKAALSSGAFVIKANWY